MARRIIRTQRERQQSGVSLRKLKRYDVVGRTELLNREQVMRSARAKSSWQARTDNYDYYIGDMNEGMNLKRGIEGMAELVSPLLTDEEMRKLRNMGAEELSALYQNNRFVFEVAFNYGGIGKTSKGAYTIDESKAADMRFMIRQYEQYYGEL